MGLKFDFSFEPYLSCKGWALRKTFEPTWKLIQTGHSQVSRTVKSTGVDELIPTLTNQYSH